MGGWLLGPDNRLAILSLGNVLEWMADARSLGQKLSNLMRDCVVNYYHYLFFHVIVISLITSTQLFQLPVEEAPFQTGLLQYTRTRRVCSRV